MASRTVYVGNIPYDSDEQDVRDFFGDFTIEVVRMITDQETGRAKGFAFVTFEDEKQAAEAVAQLDQQPLGGRTIAVREAEDRPPRRGGGRDSRRDGGRDGERDTRGGRHRD